jgi:hypothetical protein
MAGPVAVPTTCSAGLMPRCHGPRGIFSCLEATKLILPQASFSRVTGRFTAPTIEKLVIGRFIDGLASGIDGGFFGISDLVVLSILFA